MRVSETDAEPWRPSRGITAGIVIVAIAGNLGGWYVGDWDFQPWATGLLTGLALCALGLRLEP